MTTSAPASASFDVRDQAILELGMASAQLQIDKAVLSARLGRAKEIVDAALKAAQYGSGEDATVTLPRDVLSTLQGVVTSL